MLASAIVAIYLDDPTIRIMCAAIFLIGAVLLYFTLSHSTEEKQEGTDEDASDKSRSGKPPDTLPLDFKEGFVQRNTPTSNESVIAVEREEQQVTPPYQKKQVTIPESYYRWSESHVPVDDPRAEFDFLIRKLLLVLKELLVAHTVGLFWINKDRRQIVIGEFATDSKIFTTMRRIPLGNDLVSHIGETGAPEIVIDIPPISANDLLIYYDSKEHVRSFVGVPVYFQGEVIAVLTADSSAEDAFGLETVATIGHFTALVSILLRSYNQKYDLDADSKMLGTLNRMRKSMQLHPDSYGIVSAAATATSESLDWDYIAVITNDEKKQQWGISRSMTKAGNDPYVSEGSIVDLEKSVIGRMLQQMKSGIIPAPNSPEHRFFESEKIQGMGQIVAVPLMTPNRCYGMIVTEYKEKHQYADKDIEMLQRIAENAATALEILSLNDLSKNYLLIDETTRVSSRALLIRRLQEERARMIQHASGDVSFFMIALDKPDEIAEKHGRHAIDALLMNVAKTIQTVVKPYDVLGKFDQHRFGLVLLYTGSEDALLQGEKIRKAIASSVVAFDGTSFSATVSIGGCILTSSLETTQVVKMVQQAIERAASEGGNCVKIV